MDHYCPVDGILMNLRSNINEILIQLKSNLDAMLNQV
jgi:hypothetical protein